MVTSVTGFNSGKYDLNVIKQFFVPYLLKPSKQEDNDDGNDEDEEEEEYDDDDTRFVIKRQNTFMCFSTKKLQFLDIINFLAPGYSYDKYMKAYGCELQKGHFPYDTTTWTVSGNWRIVLYLLKKRYTVDSRTKAYPTRTTLAVRQCGVTTG